RVLTCRHRTELSARWRAATGGRPYTLFARRLNPQLSHARPDGGPAHAEQAGRALRPREHPPRLLERAHDVLALHLLQREERGGSPGRLAQGADVFFEDE